LPEGPTFISVASKGGQAAIRASRRATTPFGVASIDGSPNGKSR
jgi:hypothetical protein